MRDMIRTSPPAQAAAAEIERAIKAIERGLCPTALAIIRQQKELSRHKQALYHELLEELRDAFAPDAIAA